MSLKKIQPLPDRKVLDLVFQYDDDSGILLWRKISKVNSLLLGWSNKRYLQFNTRYAGEIAGHEFTTTSGAKAMQVRFDGKSYYLHRIIWKMYHGYDCNLIDHEDGNPLNNRITNLRDVDNLTNSKNCKLSLANKSGCTGVSWSKQHQMWEAYIWKDCKKYNLGVFTKIEDAVRVRKEKEVEFGYHKNHGTTQRGLSL